VADVPEEIHSAEARARFLGNVIASEWKSARR